MVSLLKMSIVAIANFVGPASQIPAPRFLQTRLSMPGCFEMCSAHFIHGISLFAGREKHLKKTPGPEKELQFVHNGLSFDPAISC
jgi:hypothetical protein